MILAEVRSEGRRPLGLSESTRVTGRDTRVRFHTDPVTATQLNMMVATIGVSVSSLMSVLINRVLAGKGVEFMQPTN